MSIMIFAKSTVLVIETRVALVDIGNHTAEQVLEWKRGLLADASNDQMPGRALGVCKKMEWVEEDEVQSLPAFVGFVDGYLYDSDTGEGIRTILSTMPVDLLKGGLELFKRLRPETDDGYACVVKGLEELINTKEGRT